MASGLFTPKEQIQAQKAGTWPAGVITVDYLLVAGGGAGGSTTLSGGSGGGGAGGFLTATSYNVNFGTSYTVTVGAGGAAAPRCGWAGRLLSRKETCGTGPPATGGERWAGRQACWSG